MDTDIHVEKTLQSNAGFSEVEDTSPTREAEYDIQNGYVLDAAQLDPTRSVKLAPDGRTVLIPQPSDGDDDPLNWSQTKKHVILAVVIACTFLPDYGSVTGAVTLIPQAK